MAESGRSLSLRARLLGVSAAVLLAFVVLTGAVLDRAFRDSADAAQGERLEALLYLLMGALDVAPDGRLMMPEPLPEARLALPGSGLYAAIVEGDGSRQWTSGSTLGLEIPFARGLAPAERRNDVQTATDGRAYRVVSQGVRWAVGDTPRALSFSVAAPLAAREAEVRAYRQSLWSALAVMAVLLLAALIAVQNWGLGPLRRLARRLAAIEAGDATEVGGRFPAELAPLADNLDRVLRRERAQLERYRGALGDLAHSLKTPLAVLRSGGAADPDELGQQLERMENIVQYQLQRATTAGASQVRRRCRWRPWSSACWRRWPRSMPTDGSPSTTVSPTRCRPASTKATRWNSSATCSTTPANGRAARCACAPNGARAACCSSSRTMAPASPTRRACSAAASAATRRRRATASASRSCVTSHWPTAANCASGGRPTVGRASRCGWGRCERWDLP